MVWIRTIPVRRRPRVACIRAHIAKRPVPGIRTQHPVPDGPKVGKCDVEWGVLCAKGDQTVKDGLQPGLTPGVLDAPTVSVGNEEVASVGRGLGEEGHLAEEVLRCLREVITIHYTYRRSFRTSVPLRPRARLPKESPQSL